MSYGYPGQGYGPGSGYYGGYGQPPPPPNQGYGQYPPPHHYPPQHLQYQPPPGPPPQGYDAYGYPIAQGPGYGSPGASRGGPPPPPSGLQDFGNGAPGDYKFQYSNCTGRRKALLIGINYFGTDGELRGCINDVRNVSAFLMERYGYKREDMVTLTDDQQNPVLQPTKDNILRAMQWLVADAQPNDALFLHYSGKEAQAHRRLDHEKHGD